MARTGAADDGLLQFLMPGLLHHLRNALFAIQGHAQSLASDMPDLEAEKAAILRGAGLAQGAVEILAHLAEERTGRPVQAGIGLGRLCEILKVPMREGGLRLSVQYTSRQTPEPVDGTILCRAMTATLQALLAALPSGFRGELGIELAFQSMQHLDILLQVRGDADTLPFPVHLDELLRAVTPQLSGWGVELRRDGREQGLQLRIPTVGP